MIFKYLNVGDKTIPYIILNKDNKNTYFRFKANYLEISKSKYTTNNDVLNYITNNFDRFYQKHLQVLKTLPKTDEIILENKKYQLMIENTRGFKYEVTSDKIIVSSNLTIDKIKYLIYENHLKSMFAKIEFQVNQVLKANKIKPLPYRFGYFKSKFGSYHRIKKEVTLNVVLAKTNIEYLYYVIMHEYAHTKVFNHSKAFYQVLRDLMPNYLNYQKTINKLSIFL